MACSGLTDPELALVREALENLKAEYEAKESAPGTKMNEQAMFQQAQDEVEEILMKIGGDNASGGRRRRRGRKTRKARKGRKGSRKARKGSRKGRKGSRKGRKGRKGTRRA